MRTQEAIVERIKVVVNQDIFGVEVWDLVAALTAETIASLRGDILAEDYDVQEFAEYPMLKTDEDVRRTAIEYLDFAWDKANSYRGLSANRSMHHYRAWLWLLGVDWVEELMEYEYYGKDCLVRICNYLGVDPAQWDDGVRRNSEPYYEEIDPNSLVYSVMEAVSGRHDGT